MVRSCLLAGIAALALACNPVAEANPCNPCGNPCANPCANPCGNPCANPCANPCGNPCANPCANPCGGGAAVDPSKFQQPAGVSLASAPREELLALGKELWNDTSLSSNNAACATCHINNYMQMQPTFAKPFPHRVAMPQQMAGVEQVNAAEMVQFCMLQPMQTETLDWTSRELAALATYVESLQAGYEPVGGASPNPCGAANPCGNPCGAANPCGNPCAAKNVCNPCAGKNPCNPCGH